MRWTPVLAVLIFLSFAVLRLRADRALAIHAYPPGSSLGTGASGLSLLRGVLEDRGVQVGVLARPLRPGALPRDAVLFRVAPSVASATLSRDEEDFVRDGGRLVLAAEGDALEDARDPVKVAPLLAGVHALAPPAAFALPDGLLIDAQPVFEHDSFPAIAVRRLAAGEAWMLAEPALLSNEQLDRADHLALAVALAGEGRPVFFDEWIHGESEQAGLLALLLRWGLGPALLLGAVALCAAGWRRAATLGPAADGFRESRTEAVDLVDSIASLYDQGVTTAGALGMFRAQLVREIALRKAVSDATAATLLQHYAPGFDASADLHSQLKLLNQAFTRLHDEHRGRP